MKNRLHLCLIGVVLCALSAWVGSNRATVSMQSELNKHIVSGEVWKLSSALSTVRLIREGKSPEATDSLDSAIDSSVCILWLYHNNSESPYSNLVKSALADAKKYRADFPREFQPSKSGGKQVDDMRKRADEILKSVQ